MRSPRALVTCALLLCGCPSKPQSNGPVPDTVCPKESPVACKVLLDQLDNNAVEYHVLVSEGTKHDDVDALLKFLYPYLWKRYGDEPAKGGAYVYMSEIAFKPPPRSPIAQVVRGSGELGPAFENKVPLEFWQEVAEAMKPAYDEKWTLARKVQRDDAAKTLVLTYPYTDTGRDAWVDALSFNQAMNAFTDTAMKLFADVPDLKAMTFSGVWKDKEVVRIEMTRPEYGALDFEGLSERIGQHHGRAFQELGLNKSTDDKAAKDMNGRIVKEYRTLVAKLKNKAKVDPGLK